MADTLNDKVSQVAGSPADRVAATGKLDQDILDAVDQLTKIKKTKNDLLEQQLNSGFSLGDTAKSLPGILALLGTIAGTATGNQGLADVSAALGSGLIEGGQQKAAKEQAAAQAGVDALNTQEDKLHSRMTQLLVSQPSMFQDSKTGEAVIDPRLIGYLSTGEFIPIDPGANYLLKKDGENKKRTYEFGLDLFTNGKTEAERKTGASIINNSLHLGWDAEKLNTVAQQPPEITWGDLVKNPGLDPLSVFDAYRLALTEGKNLWDPDVATMIRPKKKAEFKLQEHQQDLLAKFGAKIAAAPEEIRNGEFNDQVAYAFADDPAGLVEFKKYTQGPSAFGGTISVQDLAPAITARIMQLTDSFNNTKGALPIFIDNEITSADQIPGFVVKNYETSLQGMIEQQRFRSNGVFGDAIADLKALYDSTGLSGDSASLAAQEIMKAKTAATKPDGRIDLSKFEEARVRLMDEARALKDQGGSNAGE